MRNTRSSRWRCGQLLLSGALFVAVTLIGVAGEAMAEKRGRASGKKTIEMEQKKKENVRSLVMMHKNGSGDFGMVAEADYDNMGRLMSKKTFDSDGTVLVDTSNEYDGKGRLKGSKNKGKKNAPRGTMDPGQSRFKYNDNDELTELASYADSDSMLDSLLVQVNNTYDADGDVESVIIIDNNGNDQRFQYSYVGSGDMKTLDMIEEFAQGVKQSEMRFEYDADGNTTRQTRRDPDGDVLYDEELGYDADGNMMTRMSRARVREDVVDVFEVSCEYEFDPDGNVMSQKIRNRQVMVDVESETITTYDSFGNECDQMQKNLSNNEVVSRSVWDYQYRGSPPGRRCPPMNATRSDTKRGDSQ